MSVYIRPVSRTTWTTRTFELAYPYKDLLSSTLTAPSPFFVSLNDIHSKPSYSFKLLSHINRAFFNYTNSTLYSLCDLHDFSASPFESRAQRHYSSHSDSAGTRVHTTPRETYKSLSWSFEPPRRSAKFEEVQYKS